MTQWQWAMGKLNAAHAAAKYSPRLSSAFSFQLTADDRRTADWLPPQLGSVHLLLQGSSAVAVACLAGSAVKSIAAVTVGTALPTLLDGGEEGGRGGRGKKIKKREESFASGVKVEVLRDPHNPQGLSRPCVVVPEQAAHRWWLQGRGKPASCTCTHTATTALPQPSHAGVQLSKGMEEGEGHGNGTAENMHLACKTCRSGASSTSDDHSPPDVGGAL